MHINMQPLNILILAPFSPSLETDNPPLIASDPFSLDQSINELTPTLDIDADKSICSSGVVTVSIKKISDLKPQNIHKVCPHLNRISGAVSLLKNGGTEKELKESFPDISALVTFPSGKSSEEKKSSSAIDDILSMVDTGSTADSGIPDVHSVLKQLQTLYAKTLQTVYADKNFRRMESAWRGTALIASQVPSGSKTGLSLTLVPMPSGDSIPVFDVLEQSFEDNPPDIIVLDKSFSNSPHSMAEIERIMDFAESMLAPAFFTLDPTFFQIDNWDQLSKVRFIPALMEGAEYGKWKTLVTKSGAGWLIPCVGEFLTRPAYSESSVGFSEIEYLWASTPFAMGALCAKSAALFGSMTRFNERNNITLSGLDMTEDSNPSPLKISFDRDRLRDLQQAGISTIANEQSRDTVFTTSSVTMDGEPLRFKLFLSRIIGFLIRLSRNQSEDVKDPETDIRDALALFMDLSGLNVPEDLKVTAIQEQNSDIQLEITFTPDSGILDSNGPITFGFTW